MPMSAVRLSKGMTLVYYELDEEQNAKRGEELKISPEDSKVKVLLIPTDEELMIARDVERLRG